MPLYFPKLTVTCGINSAFSTFQPHPNEVSSFPNLPEGRRQFYSFQEFFAKGLLIC